MHHGIHHFHGTPVWGSAGDVHRIAVSGAGAFVSYVRPDQIAASIQHAQVVGIDNGAFSAWVRGLKINWSDFYKWLLNYYHHPKVAFFVIPDVVDGGERDNDALINEVPKMFYGRQLPSGICTSQSIGLSSYVVNGLVSALDRLVNMRLSELRTGIVVCRTLLKQFIADTISKQLFMVCACLTVVCWEITHWRLPTVQILPAMSPNLIANILS